MEMVQLYVAITSLHALRTYDHDFPRPGRQLHTAKRDACADPGGRTQLNPS
jgi:hypothetical protein